MPDNLSSEEQVMGENVPTVSFPETSYGIVKRLETIESWTAAVAKRLGKTSISILDYGCGTGDHVTYPLACRDHRVLGVDFHEASINEASRRYRLPNLSFQTAEIDELLKPGQQFDLVVCSEVLEHLHKPQHFLETVSRLLRAGGGLVITTPNGYGSFEWLMSLQKALDRVGLMDSVKVAHVCLGSKPGGGTAPP